MTTLCLLLVPAACLISAVSNGFLLRAAQRRGLLDRTGSQAHKTHARDVPSVGGVGIYLAVMLPLAAGLLFAWLFARIDLGLPDAVARHASGVRRMTPLALAVLAAATLFHGMGLVDDRVNLSARGKLGVQLIVAVTLAGVFDVRVLTLLDAWGPLGWLASLTLSTLWLAGLTNAMNMLDNMDGLAGGVGAIMSAAMLTIALAHGQWFVAGLTAALLGSLLGFLVWNRPPAKLFMGDGGSLVIGLLLGVASVRLTYVGPGSERGDTPQALPVIAAPWLIVLVPFADMVSVMVTRWRAGRPLMQGDQNHLSHRLVRAGLSRPGAVAVLCGASGLCGTLAVWLTLS